MVAEEVREVKGVHSTKGFNWDFCPEEGNGLIFTRDYVYVCMFREFVGNEKW